MKRGVAIVGGFGLVFAATLARADGANSFFSSYGVNPPEASRITYCHGYGCAFRTRLGFSSGEIGRLGSIMSGGRASPAAERAAISHAVQWFEKKAGREAGTSTDKAKLGAMGGDPTQLDCIDEASNTTSLLVLMEKRGLLRHHTVLAPRTRGFLLDFRYPHNAAVIEEKKGGERWVVDSWPRANGEKPDIMKLETWLASS
ncbi:MAG: hypothetical protein H6883_12990 [Rhodobiaceae bacterium]|nr:hypothetical protein [Rhodobiaceae bacterium]MCC0057040.1 hypothetical protein [Rhodobiaceae bacterium]